MVAPFLGDSIQYVPHLHYRTYHYEAFATCHSAVTVR